MRFSTGGPTDVDPLNMTPMIDCVFQLLIFFMLVTDMSSLPLEAITPARTVNAMPDHRPDEKRVIINVSHRTGLRCADFGVYDDDPSSDGLCRREGHWVCTVEGAVLTPDALGLHLAGKASGLDSRGRPWRRPESGVSDLPVMIRADARAPYGEVQKVLQVCSDPRWGVGVWKVEFGVQSPPKE